MKTIPACTSHLQLICLDVAAVVDIVMSPRLQKTRSKHVENRQDESVNEQLLERENWMHHVTSRSVTGDFTCSDVSIRSVLERRLNVFMLVII